MNGTNIFRNLKHVFVIAEAGVNHNGDLLKAYRLVDEAKKAGADAVKFQTSIPLKSISKYAKMAKYQIDNIGEETSMIEMAKKISLPFDSFRKLKKYCDEIGIIFLSTPFHLEAADFLNDLVPYFKVPSGEITNYPLLENIAKKRKPIILSTGMCSLSEIEEAIEIFYNEGNKNIILLHCTSNYPCPFNEVNLKAMQTLAYAFKLPIGYSDHTLGIEVPIAAVAMGAKIIEKHFTLDKKLPGPDHKASLEPNELKEMVKAIRNIEKALGDGIKKPNKSEIEIMKVARKSLIATKDIRAGEIIKESDIAIKRPGTGIPPKFKEIVIGMKILKNVSKDEIIKWEDFK